MRNTKFDYKVLLHLSFISTLKKRIKIHATRFAVLALLILLSACSNSGYTPSSRWSLASIYNPTTTYLHPSYKVYHNNANTSVLFLKIRTSELFFREYAINNKAGCNFTIDYLLQEIGADTNTLVDSNTYVYQLRKEDVNNYYITQIPFKAQEDKSYRLKVTLTDHYRNDKNISYLHVEKQQTYGEQFFNVTNISGIPLFKNIVIDDGAFRINHRTPQSDTLYISYYKNNKQPAQALIAPISDELFYAKRDSLFAVAYNKATALAFHYEGLYFIQFDTNSQHGISILKINSDFPKVREPDGLIPPLSYLTSEAQQAQLSAQENPKKAADNFWLNIAGNTSKARELIRLYYNRTYFSNYYFTNTAAGWSTDRGMIYTIYGPPHNLTKTADSEIWKYNRKETGSPITFTFKYTPNKYGLNNYKLQRSNSHTWHWTEAIYAWTSGDIFFYD